MKKKRNLGKDHGTVTGVHMVQAIVLEPQARQDYSQGSLRRTLKEDCALLLGLISLRVTYLKKKIIKPRFKEIKLFTSHLILYQSKIQEDLYEYQNNWYVGR